MGQFHEIVPELIINCSGACFTAKVEVEQFHENVPELFRNCSGVLSLLFYSKKWMWNNFTKLFLNCSGIVPVRFSPVLQQKWRWGMFIFVPDLFRDPPCQAFCGGFRPSVYALNGLFNEDDRHQQGSNEQRQRQQQRDGSDMRGGEVRAASRSFAVEIPSQFGPDLPTG